MTPARRDTIALWTVGIGVLVGLGLLAEYLGARNGPVLVMRFALIAALAILGAQSVTRWWRARTDTAHRHDTSSRTNPPLL